MPAKQELDPAVARRRKSRAAALSICSNIMLVVLKLIASAVTGSIALLTDAVHSSIDLVASVIAFVAVRKADAPADASHPYGHEKAENLAAAVEGVLILAGAVVIVYEASQRLVAPAHLQSVGVGMVVVLLSLIANLAVSTYLHRQARATESAALEGDAAHLRADAMTSAGVLVALVLVQLTGIARFDPAMAMLVAVAIVISGARIVTRAGRTLLDESLPEDELTAVCEAIASHGSGDLAGYHKLRARRAGSRRHVDLHAQFASGTSLERAHEVSHELTECIRQRVPRADVLIHLEPHQAGWHTAEAAPAQPARPGRATRSGWLRAKVLTPACAVVLLVVTAAVWADERLSTRDPVRAAAPPRIAPASVQTGPTPTIQVAAAAVEAGDYARAVRIAALLSKHDQQRIRRKISRHLAKLARAAAEASA